MLPGIAAAAFGTGSAFGSGDDSTGDATDDGAGRVTLSTVGNKAWDGDAKCFGSLDTASQPTPPTMAVVSTRETAISFCTLFPFNKPSQRHMITGARNRSKV